MSAPASAVVFSTRAFTLLRHTGSRSNIRGPGTGSRSSRRDTSARISPARDGLDGPQLRLIRPPGYEALSPSIEGPGHRLWHACIAECRGLRAASSTPRHQVLNGQFLRRARWARRAWATTGRAALRRQPHQRFDRVVPGMQREIERAPVNGQQRAAAYKRVRRERVLRARGVCRPRRDETRRSRASRGRRHRSARVSLGVFGREPGVAAEKDPVALRRDHPRRPQRLVAVLEAATGEMLRGRGGEREIRAGHACGSHQSSSTMRSGRDAEVFEVRADAERRDDGTSTVRAARIVVKSR